MNTEEKAKAYDDIVSAAKKRLTILIAKINAISQDAEKKAKVGYFEECAGDLERISGFINEELNSFFYDVIEHL